MRIILTILLSMSLAYCFGQQEPQYSNYQMNNFMLNPAVAGSYNFWNVKAGYRAQWVGMNGGPQTGFATVHGPIYQGSRLRRNRSKRPHHGLGFTASYDQAGAISYSQAMGTYAFHTKLDEKHFLSIGASFGMKEFRLDANKLKFVQTAIDPELNGGVYSSVSPDLNLGMWLYSDYMFIGISARQLLQSGIELKTPSIDNPEDISKLHNHYFVTAGTKLNMNYNWAFIPSVMLQIVNPAPMQVDINGTFWFKETYAIGFSYRHLDAIYLILDYVHDDRLEIGYAFDLTLSELNRYNSGSHEIIIGYRIQKDNRRVRCPAKFW